MSFLLVYPCIAKKSVCVICGAVVMISRELNGRKAFDEAQNSISIGFSVRKKGSLLPWCNTNKVNPFRSPWVKRWPCEIPFLVAS